MRRIHQVNQITPTLGERGLGGLKGRQNEADRIADPTALLSFPAHWNEPDVRGMLYAIHGKACAYCGSYLPHNDRGDVDHYRPKGMVNGIKDDGYWWIAYTAQNYFLSCSSCNRVRKRSYFPLRPRAKRVHYENRSKLRHEARFLLDPSIDPVEEWLTVDWQDKLCPLQPRNGLTGVPRKQVEETLRFFKINTDPDLVKERIAIRNLAHDALENRQFTKLRDLAIRYQPHSVIAKQILIERDPSYLPSPEQELSWLLRQLVESLDLTLKLASVIPDEIQQLKAAEILWSLAILWRDPPYGTAAEIEAFLNENGIVENVRGFYVKL